jgi:hypothetical protein
MKYLATGAGQSQNGPLWMHAFWRLDLASYMKKVADKNAVTKGQACLPPILHQKTLQTKKKICGNRIG